MDLRIRYRSQMLGRCRKALRRLLAHCSCRTGERDNGYNQGESRGEVKGDEEEGGEGRGKGREIIEVAAKQYPHKDYGGTFNEAYLRKVWTVVIANSLPIGDSQPGDVLQIFTWSLPHGAPYGVFKSKNDNKSQPKVELRQELQEI